MRRTSIALAMAVGFMAATPMKSAEAEVPPVLRPATGGMWANFKLGPAINLSKYATQFKLSQTFGYHLSQTPVGPAIAIDLQESFGNNFFTFNIVPRFVWDFQPIPGLGLYIGPSVGFGFTLVDGHPGFTAQIAVDGKLALNQKFYVLFRPFGLEINGVQFSVRNVSAFEVGTRWDFLFGGGMYF